MSAILSLPADVEERLFKEAKQEYVQRMLDRDDSDFMTKAQACGMLNITPRAFDTLGVDKIDMFLNGSTFRYWKSDILALMRERTIKG